MIKDSGEILGLFFNGFFYNLFSNFQVLDRTVNFQLTLSGLKPLRFLRLHSLNILFTQVLKLSTFALRAC